MNIHWIIAGILFVLAIGSVGVSNHCVGIMIREINAAAPTEDAVNFAFFTLSRYGEIIEKYKKYRPRGKLYRIATATMIFSPAVMLIAFLIVTPHHHSS